MSPSSAPRLQKHVLVRRAEPRDAGTIDRLVAALAAETGPGAAKASSPADFATALSAAPPFIHVLFAEHGGDVIGLCIWFPWFSTWRGTAGVYVQDLYVVEAMRGAGVARRLLVAAARALRAPGATFIRLGVDADNAAGLGFYAGLGFERMEREHVLDLSGPAYRRLVAPTETHDNVTDPE